MVRRRRGLSTFVHRHVARVVNSEANNPGGPKARAFMYVRWPLPGAFVARLVATGYLRWMHPSTVLGAPQVEACGVVGDGFPVSRGPRKATAWQVIFRR